VGGATEGADEATETVTCAAGESCGGLAGALAGGGSLTPAVEEVSGSLRHEL
jgi:hypothetical protein